MKRWAEYVAEHYLSDLRALLATAGGEHVISRDGKDIKFCDCNPKLVSGLIKKAAIKQPSYFCANLFIEAMLLEGVQTYDLPNYASYGESMEYRILTHAHASGGARHPQYFLHLVDFAKPEHLRVLGCACPILLPRWFEEYSRRFSADGSNAIQRGLAHDRDLEFPFLRLSSRVIDCYMDELRRVKCVAA